MTKKIKYSDLLRNPMWQKMRLEILQRDEFTCQLCFDSENTLHVHHKYYKYGNDPWDYPEESLITLCEKCHEEETDALRTACADLITILKQSGFMSEHINRLSTMVIHGDLDNLKRGSFDD